jgi:membrane protein YdbS with pleckstrin-like domain
MRCIGAATNIAGLLVGAVLGLLWPYFVAFRPVAIGLVATFVYAIVWLWMFGRLLQRRGWRHMWLVLVLPFVLYWPAIYAYMAGCVRSNSCS